MKRHLIVLISCIGITGIELYAQSSGGGSSGASSGGSSGASGVTPAHPSGRGPFSPVQPNTAPSAPQTGQNQNQNSSGTTPSGAAVGANGFATNSAGVVPQTGTGTNLPNQLGAGTNSMGTSPNGGFTNQFGAFTNSFRTNGLVLDQTTTPQDKVLAQQIRQALLQEIRETQAPIHLIVNNGAVTLVGFTPSSQVSVEIESRVRNTPGVVNVVNNLQIGREFGREGTSRFGFANEDRGDNDRDRDLIGHARSEMRRHNRFQGEDESVHIVSRNGVVTLTGLVANTQQEQGFLTAVQNTPGVVQVINQLQVSGQASANTGTTGTAAVTNNQSVPSGGLGPHMGNQLGIGGPNAFVFRTNQFGITTNLTPVSRENSPSRFFPNTTNSINGTNMEQR